jgi:hypothetical protein
MALGMTTRWPVGVRSTVVRSSIVSTTPEKVLKSMCSPMVKGRSTRMIRPATRFFSTSCRERLTARLIAPTTATNPVRGTPSTESTQVPAKKRKPNWTQRSISSRALGWACARFSARRAARRASQ